MRIVIINPRHPSVTSRSHKGGMPPLGLLAVGGPLIDDGHDVSLIDADIRSLTRERLVGEVLSTSPDVVLIGHSGSTSAHPEVTQVASALKSVSLRAPIVYGGIFPTYHAEEILTAHPEIDVIVRGEGEKTALCLLRALRDGLPLADVCGIAYRDGDRILSTGDAEPIVDLDAYRVGWELIDDWDLYHYWGAGRSAVIQFSRGCPHRCTYCGQRFFWVRWRRRDPRKVAAEIGMLHRRYGVRFVDLADENPTTIKAEWRQFLEALIAENVPVQLVTTIRAADIVRDADILPLYKQAGFSRILMGIETTNRETQKRIRKGSTPDVDRQAVDLLRRNGILSQVAYVVGFESDTDRSLLAGLSELLRYDPDQVNAMYVTPHSWTPFARECDGREIVEPDLGRWDYRHQVLAAAIPQWRLFLWVKATELVVQLRPRAIWRLLFERDPGQRRASWWCYGVGIQAWCFEVKSFLLRMLAGGPHPHSFSQFARIDRGLQRE